jgi:hypothetical protein
MDVNLGAGPATAPPLGECGNQMVTFHPQGLRIGMEVALISVPKSPLAK